MSGKKDDKFYEEEEEEEENKKYPPNHRVSRSNPNELHKQRDTRSVCQGEMEDTKCPPQQFPQSNVNEERADHKPAKHHVRKHRKHARKHHKREHKHHKHNDSKQPSMESLSHKKEHVTFAQKDEEAIAMEEGVLSEEWDKITEATGGDVPGSDPNEWEVSKEARKTAHGSSGGQHAASSLKVPDASPGTEALDSPPTRPGAQRVPGPGNQGLGDDDDDDEEQMTIVSREESIIPIVPEAERVNTEEEERRRQAAINQGIGDFIATAAVADVVPDFRGRRLKMAGASLLVTMILIAVIIGAVLGTNRETQSPLGYGALLSSVSSDKGEALRNSSAPTPQYMAFKWMVTDNALFRPNSDEQIIQRYALATLFNSTHGDNWLEKELWLDDDDECGRWKTPGGSLVCTDSEASQLFLSSNNLQGTVPPEIGLLSKLGEFIVKESCQDALAHSLWASTHIHLLILMICLDCLCSFSKSYGKCAHWYDSI
jgi:hypothetical protein